MKRIKSMPAAPAAGSASRRIGRSKLAKAIAADELLISMDPRQTRLPVFTRINRRRGRTK